MALPDLLQLRLVTCVRFALHSSPELVHILLKQQILLLLGSSAFPLCPLDGLAERLVALVMF